MNNESFDQHETHDPETGEIKFYVGRCVECRNSIWSNEEYYADEEYGYVCDNCLGD